MIGDPVDRACRGCGERALRLVLDLGRQPLANAYLRPDELDGPEPHHPLVLVFCEACALAQLADSVPPEDMFDEYLYFSSNADTMVEHARLLVERIVSERGMGPDSLAMEVASNDGYLLQHYVASGVPVLGVDPARNIVPAAEARGVPTLCEYFGADVGRRLRSEGHRADVVHANNVLAHVPDVNGFIAGVVEVLSDDGLFVVETPHVQEMVDDLEFDTIYHEHLFYYSVVALNRLFRGNGLEIVDVERIAIHGGSLRVWGALPGAHAAAPAVAQLMEAEREDGLDTFDAYRHFAEHVSSHCNDLRALLAGLAGEGRRVAAYGAAAKGTVLLNALGDHARDLEFVADRSPHKQGRLMPGVHVPIVEPAALAERRPDDVLLLAWNFADEIVDQQQAYLDAGGRFILPRPGLPTIP